MEREILQEIRFQANQYWNFILRQYQGDDFFELSRVHVTASQEISQAEQYIGKIDFSDLAKSLIPPLKNVKKN